MNFEEFKQQLMEDLKEALSRRVGTEVAVEENEVHKLQQESYDGIDSWHCICTWKYIYEGSRRKEEGNEARLYEK